MVVQSSRMVYCLSTFRVIRSLALTRSATNTSFRDFLREQSLLPRIVLGVFSGLRVLFWAIVPYLVWAVTLMWPKSQFEVLKFGGCTWDLVHTRCFYLFSSMFLELEWLHWQTRRPPETFDVFFFSRFRLRHERLNSTPCQIVCLLSSETWQNFSAGQFYKTSLTPCPETNCNTSPRETGCSWEKLESPWTIFGDLTPTFQGANCETSGGLPNPYHPWDW